MSEPLRQGATVGLDGSGGGRIRLGPDYGPSPWHITQITVRTSSPGQGSIPQCTVYVDTEDANGLVDATYDGSQDSSVADITLSQGSHLIAVWEDGNPGDVATLSVLGEKG